MRAANEYDTPADDPGNGDTGVPATNPGELPNSASIDDYRSSPQAFLRFTDARHWSGYKRERACINGVGNCDANNKARFWFEVLMDPGRRVLTKTPSHDLILARFVNVGRTNDVSFPACPTTAKVRTDCYVVLDSKGQQRLAIVGRDRHGNALDQSTLTIVPLDPSLWFRPCRPDHNPYPPRADYAGCPPRRGMARVPNPLVDMAWMPCDEGCCSSGGGRDGGNDGDSTVTDSVHTDSTHHDAPLHSSLERAPAYASLLASAAPRAVARQAAPPNVK